MWRDVKMKKLDLIILYVEDDEDIAEEVAEFLQHMVQELYVATNGEEGLRMYYKYHPDIIITDIQMPLMDGLEMIRKIREDDKEIPVLVTSAYDDSEFLVDSINLGVDGYLMKPLDFEVMMKRIQNLGEPIEITKHIRQLNI